MRIFTAIPLPSEIKDRIAEITRGRLPVPYINTTNLHITLNFFGELTDGEIEKAKSLLEDAVSGQKSFDLEFEALTKFRQQLHITLKKNPEIMNLQQNMKDKFEAAGFKFEPRPYYPHIKLANLHMDKIMNPERKIENFPNSEISALKFKADKVTLYQSQLLLHHAKHTPILEVPLS